VVVELYIIQNVEELFIFYHHHLNIICISSDAFNYSPNKAALLSLLLSNKTSRYTIV